MICTLWLLSLSHIPDIDECETGDNNCDGDNGKCINKPGSFNCFCKEGFEGDGVNCTAISDNESEFVFDTVAILGAICIHQMQL